MEKQNRNKKTTKIPHEKLPLGDSLKSLLRNFPGIYSIRHKFSYNFSYNKEITSAALLLTIAIFPAILFFSYPIKNLIEDSKIIAEATGQERVREADEKVRAAEDRVKAAEAEQQRIREEKAARERDRSNLEQQRGDLRRAMDELDEQMAAISLEIARLESDIAKKVAEIEQAELDLLEAIRIKEEQYANMKIRVKYSYERREFLLIETLFTAGSLSEFLNYADYLLQLAEYEEMKLNEFFAIEKMVEDLKDKLIEDKLALDELLAQVQIEQAKVMELINTTASRISATSAQITETERELLQKEEEEKRKSRELDQLRRQLAEEIRLRELAKQMVWRNLSDVTFAEGDRYLLANLIFCEAGGEPYNGKVAVGAVVMNRVLSPVFPDTIVGVIYQNRQFSPVASGRLALALAEDRATASCYRAADEAMAGASPVGNCLFFRTPIEGLTGLNIGGHVFY